MTDAVVVGSGPNGLAGAVTLARAGLSVLVLEGESTPGGGCRTGPRTLPGFEHDICSAVHPMVVASPFFRELDLVGKGLVLCQPEVAFAHPLEDGRAGVVRRSLEETAAGLGADGPTYRRLLGPLVRQSDAIVEAAFSPIRSVPPHPLAAARFGALGVLPARLLAGRFSTDEGRAILGGVGGHSMLALDAPLSGAFALLLATLAHSAGWPVVQGGSARIVDALVNELVALGGRLETGQWVRSLGELPAARTILLDVSTPQLVAMAGPALPPGQRRSLGRFRYGPGVCKVDWALRAPVPWDSAACRRAATLHVGGTLEEVVRSEADVAAGRHPEHPYCIVVQPSVLDPSRAPGGAQTLWGYCHVPAGSDVDMAAAIEAQIERFAPGFADVVLERHAVTARQMEAYDPNYVGGDINGGSATLRQTLARPSLRWNPYRTGIDGVYLCSASTPPGGGVHGMCGYHAARTALSDLGLRPQGP